LELNEVEQAQLDNQVFMLCEEGTNYGEITDEMVTEHNGSEFRFI